VKEAPVITREPRYDCGSTRVESLPDSLLERPLDISDARDLEREVEYIVDDCFFTVGQVVGMRTTVDYEAVIWWRDHYRARFLAAMTAFGNRWLQDRSNVTSVAIMLAERAVRYAEGKPSIDCDAARQSAADVQRYCELHSRRAARSRGLEHRDDAPARIAGYWCTEDPIP
jgi:hypothetical protein